MTNKRKLDTDDQPRPKRVKLTSATPLSGKNIFYVTRKTSLGAYMRRCKEVVIKDGYKTLHLNAMGAAIPHLLQLVVALPKILPYAAEEISSQILTGTTEVRDEIIPEDDDEDVTYDTRKKSTLTIVIKIGDGQPEAGSNAIAQAKEHSDVNNKVPVAPLPKKARKSKDTHPPPEQIVFQEPEQDNMEAD